MRALLALLLLLPPVAAQDAARPRFNTSFVPDDDEELAALVLQVRQSIERLDASATAAHLDALLARDEPGLIAVRNRELFLSHRRWAQFQLLAGRTDFDAQVLAAWRDLHDAGATTALRGALLARDEPAVLDLADRYPAATGIPTALLALSDRALLRADPGTARGFLLRIPDHLPLAEARAWSESPAATVRLRHLDRLAPRPPAGWPTLGGAPDRARRGDALPDRLELLWEAPFLEQVPDSFVYAEGDRSRESSPILPCYPVCDEKRVYLHLGRSVAAIDRESGKLLFHAPGGRATSDYHVGVLMDASPGVRAPTLHEGILYFDRVRHRSGWAGHVEQSNELVAFDPEQRQIVWRVRPGEGAVERHPVLGKAVFFRGAAAVAGDRLYVYGAIRGGGDGGPTRKEEAHLFCFDRRDGTPVWSRFLGYGDTEAAPRFPPLSGLSPALGAGVVVAVSGLGVATALDARTGETLWTLRYDRRPVRERERLSDWNERKVHLRSGWMREPPRISGGTVFFAPFDSRELYACWLRGRRAPGSGVYDVVQWTKERTSHRNTLLESIAGLAGGRVWCVGRFDRHHSRAAYQTVVSVLADKGNQVAYGRIPADQRDNKFGVGFPPEVFGRPTIAGDLLLVPTRRALYRFDVGAPPGESLREGELFREIRLRAPLPAPARESDGAEDEPPPMFGTLVAVGGRLYAVTADRLLCYGSK